MDVRQCRSCGKIFNYLSGAPVCEACKDRLEKKFVEVKEYIRENKGATLSQISEEMEISEKQLKQWIKEERLSFSDDSPIGFECENCGTMIKTGRFCQACKSKLGNKLDSAINRPQAEPMRKSFNDNKNKMRFL